MITGQNHNNETWSETFPLTSLQLSYYYGRNGRNREKPIFLYSKLEGGMLDKSRLENALKKIVLSNDALRCAVLDNGTQRIRKPSDDIEISVAFSNLSALSASEAEERLKEITHKICCTEIATGTYPMLYAELTKMPGNRHILHIYVDGLVCDAWTNNEIIAMLDRFYTYPETAAETGIPFEQYVRESNEKKEKENDIYFWEETVRNFPEPIAMPMADGYISSEHSIPIESKIRLDAAAVSAIEKYAVDHDVSLRSIFLALYCRCVSMYSENVEFIVNIPQFLRLPEYETVSGECSDYILFPYRRKKGETFLCEIKRIDKELQIYFAHGSVSGSRITELYRETSDMTELLAAPIVFSDLLDLPAYELSTFNRKDFCTHTSCVWADCGISRIGKEILINIDSSENILRSDMIERIADQMKSALMEIEKWEHLTALSLLSHDEKIIVNFSNTGTIDSSVPYAVRIEKAIQRFGSNTAVYTEDSAYSYKQFYAEVCRRISRIIETEIPQHKKIAVVLGKGFELIAWSQAIVLGGYVYAPLDYDYAPELMKQCIIALKPELIITDETWYSKLSDAGVKIIRTDNPLPERESPFSICASEDKFAVIHTSGSTGIPKGVELSHAGVLNCLYFSEKEFGITENSCIMTVTNHCHDMSLYDQFGLFICGGACAVMNQENWLDPYTWRDMIINCGVTIWNSVPSIMMAFIAFLEEDSAEIIRRLRLIIHGGDFFTLDEVTVLKKYHPDMTIYNVGGPTETTIWSVFHKVTDEDVKKGSIPYGKPIPSMRYAVLNQFKEPVPVGIKGNMFISGIGTVNEYIDGRNKEKFSYIDGAVWYDCGDTGYLTEDGSLMICGRNDRQIKRNGKRIELGGIETKLREIEGISNAVVVTENGKELIAFYTAGQKYDTAKLRKQLADMLPDYMLPDDFIFTAAFPLTHNGKINTKALLELYQNTEKSGRDCFLSSEEQLHELVEICENQLQIKGLKPDDNFFKIGGDSLSAIMLITELNSIYECELSLADIFTYPVLGELCDIIHHHERN